MNGTTAPSDRRSNPAAYVAISTADGTHALRLIALRLGLRRWLRVRVGKDESAYELWLDRFQRGVLTVFPPVVNDERSSLKVMLDGKDVTNGHCSFRAFTGREQALTYFQRHDGTLANVDDETRGDIVIEK